MVLRESNMYMQPDYSNIGSGGVVVGGSNNNHNIRQHHYASPAPQPPPAQLHVQQHHQPKQHVKVHTSYNTQIFIYVYIYRDQRTCARLREDVEQNSYAKHSARWILFIIPTSQGTSRRRRLETWKVAERMQIHTVIISAAALANNTKNADTHAFCKQTLRRWMSSASSSIA